MKRSAALALSMEERNVLRTIAESDQAPRRVAKRAVILLMASERTGDNASGAVVRVTDHRIAASVGVCADTVRSTIHRFTASGLEAAVYDKPIIRKVTPEAERELISLVQSSPPVGLSRWTLQLLAEKLRDMELVESISDTGVWDILQKRGIRIDRTGGLNVESAENVRQAARNHHE